MGKRRQRPSSRYLDIWEGGYTRRNAKGVRTYVIRTEVNGTRFHVSTRCHTESAALEHWRRFQRSPSAYTPLGDDGTPLPLSDELLSEYLAFCGTAKDGKGNTPAWVREKRRYLRDWQTRLGGRSLRRLTARELLAALDVKDENGRKPGARAHRIATLKHLFTWLRTVRHLVNVADDPTYGTISIPQSDPRRRKISNKSFPKAHYIAAREHLVGHWRDALDVAAGTAAHVTALGRFARSGSIEPYRGNSEVAAGVLVFSEKMHAVHRVAVSAEVLAAAERLLAHGSLDRDKFDDAVRNACRAAKVPIHTPARYRHAVATWAIEAGADPAQLAAFLGHRDPRTTRRFYSTHAVPVKVPTLA
jgi:integrase